MNDIDDYLTIKEAAGRLRLHEETVRRHIRAGNLRADYIGRRWRIRKGDLIDFSRHQTEQHLRA